MDYMDTTSGNEQQQQETGSINNNVNSAEAVPYVESKYWCSIAYYELNSRVGEVNKNCCL